jgi:hypothetical protein
MFFVFFLVDITACYAIGQNEKKSENTVYAKDMTVYASDLTAYAKRITEDAGEITEYARELTEYASMLTRYQYSEYIDGIYVSELQTKNYIDTRIVFNDEHTLNIDNLIVNVSIGSGVIILAAITIPALMPVLAPEVGVIVIKIINDAMLGAALDAALQGTIKYIVSGGDMEVAFYSSVEGAAEGFMWGAIVSSVARPIEQAKLFEKNRQTGKVVQKNLKSDVLSSTNENFSTNVADDFLEKLPKEEFIKKYDQQIYDDLLSWSGKDFRTIQAILRGKIAGTPEMQERVKRIVKFLNDQRSRGELTLFRGENLSKDLLAENYNLRNVSGKSPEEIAQMLKMAKSHVKNTGLLPTSRVNGPSIKYIAANGTSTRNPENLKIIREIRAPSGTHAYDISEISKFPHQQEVLLISGIETEVIDTYIETIRTGSQGNYIYHKVIHIIEKVL